MPADNTLYDLHASGWWDENHFLHTLKTGLNPVRFAYFEQILRGYCPPSRLPAVKILDLGCGGGLLSEEFARLGCMVTGIDPSPASVETARKHAAENGLEIAYHIGQGERLPFPSAHFDMVVCCDVLEHITDLPRVLQESARVLKPGGIYGFDTINRTAQSFFEHIFIAQSFPLTSFFAPHTHDWQQFIQPAELTGHLTASGLRLRHMTGLRPGIPPFMVAIELIRRKLGLISFGQLGEKLQFTTSAGMGGSYIGWAQKAGA